MRTWAVVSGNERRRVTGQMPGFDSGQMSRLGTGDRSQTALSQQLR